MPPKVNCPNCKQKEWLENQGLTYHPKVGKTDDGKYIADAANGFHVKTWRCNNCMYIMQFWEPD